ncbi:MAG: phosphoribosylglycinamide formyltransferase [archaeon]|nr:phosphoribosylglycinamide formyltransferase [archaeon]
MAAIMLRLGWFSTGRGPGSRNLLQKVMDKKADGTLDIEISFVFCNEGIDDDFHLYGEQRTQFFDMIKDYDIPLIVVSWRSFKPNLWKVDRERWREEYGNEIRRKIRNRMFDLGILAGYMLWLDNVTCTQYDFVNLHPALPNGPKGTWKEVIWQLIRNNEIYQGAMMHVCTPEWDRGSPITYCEFSIHNREYVDLWMDLDKRLETKTLDEIVADEGAELPLFKKIREDGAKRELPLIVETIRKFASGDLCIKEKKPYVNGKQLNYPYDLSLIVDEKIGDPVDGI